VVRIISGAANQEIDAKIENDFAEELSGVLRDLTNGQTHDEILMAMCLVKYRIDSEFGLDQMLELHPDIVSQLAELYRQEEAKSTDRLIDASKDEAEGVEKVAKKPTSKAKPMI
jgi:hypothetical protein